MKEMNKRRVNYLKCTPLMSECARKEKNYSREIFFVPFKRGQAEFFLIKKLKLDDFKFE